MYTYTCTFVDKQAQMLRERDGDSLVNGKREHEFSERKDEY